MLRPDSKVSLDLGSGFVFAEVKGAVVNEGGVRRCVSSIVVEDLG
jgi:hypothetical protein